MITTAQEYYKNLYRIQSTNLPDRALLIPSTEPIYKINLDTRTITGPQTLSVAKDHNSEIVYFKVARYYEGIDLTTKAAVVQYINANNVGGIYPVPFYDTTVEDGYIVFPWEISGKATEKDGTVKYNVMFFEVEEYPSNSGSDPLYKIVYKLSTIPATGRVLYGLDIDEEVEEEYDIDADYVNEVIQRLKDYADSAQLTWLDLSATEE